MTTVEDRALNVIGKPYDADAVMIGRAFEWAAAKGRIRDTWANVAEYVWCNASDRRYKVHPLAASSLRRCLMRGTAIFGACVMCLLACVMVIEILADQNIIHI